MNHFEHPDMIAREALIHMEDALVIQALCAKDLTAEYNSRPNGYKIGDSVRFKTNPVYQTKEFQDTNVIAIQPIRSSTRSLTIEKHFDVSVEVTTRQLALDFNSFSEEVLKPAGKTLAASIDRYVASKALQAAGLYNPTGAGKLFESAADIAQARKAAIIQQLGDSRFCLMDLDLEASLLGQTWFNQSQTRGDAGLMTLKEAYMGRTMGIDFFSSINFANQQIVAGSGVSTTDNTGDANQLGDKVLKIDASTGTFKAGDRIMIADVRRPLIVAAEAVATSTAIALVDPIAEIIPDGAAVTVVAAGKTINVQGAIFDHQSLGVAMPTLDKPGDKVSAIASENGVSIRFVSGYDMTHKTTTMSFDVLVGAFCIDPRRVTLLANN